MNEELDNPLIDPELEARIVALVMGEASDFEADELHRLMEQQPALAEFKSQIESTHQLMNNVGDGEWDEQDADWKLPSKQRTALLDVIEGRMPVSPSTDRRAGAVGPRMAFRGSVALAAIVALLWLGVVAIEKNNDQLQSPATIVASAEINPPLESAGFSEGVEGRIGYFERPDGFVLSDGSVRWGDDSLSRFDDAVSLSPSDALAGIQDSLGTSLSDAPVAEPSSNTDAFWFDGRSSGSRAIAGGEQSESEESSTLDDQTIVPSYLADSGAEFGFEPSNLSEAPPQDEYAGEALFDRFRQEKSNSGPISLNWDSKPQDAAEGFSGEATGGVTFGNGTSTSKTESLGRSQLPLPTQTPADAVKPLQNIDRYQAGTEALYFESKQQPNVQFKGPNTYWRKVDGQSRGQQPLSNRDGIVESPNNVFLSLRSQLKELESGQAEGRGGGTAGMSAGGGQAMPNRSFGLQVPPVRSQAIDSVTDDDLAAMGGAGGYGGGGLFAGGGVGSGMGVGGGGFGGGRGQDVTRRDSSGVIRGLQGIESQQRGSVPAKVGDEAESVPTEFNAALEAEVEPEIAAMESMKQGALSNLSSLSRSMELMVMPDGYADADRWEELTPRRRPANKQRLLLEDESVERALTEKFVADGEEPQGEESPMHLLPSLGTGTSGSVDKPTEVEGKRRELSRRTTNESLKKLKRLSELKAKGATGRPEVRFVVPEVTSSSNPDGSGRVDSVYTSPVETNNAWAGYVPPKSKVVEKSETPAEVAETSASQEPFSTFSLHVSDVSFQLAQSALAQGKFPDADRIRVEEFVNALDYGDPLPRPDEKVACRMEQAIHPFLQQRNLLRISMRTSAIGRATNVPLRLTLLLDHSGSMERTDRQQTVRQAFALLAQQLQPNDQVTVISFARQPRLLADKVSGERVDQILASIQNLPSEGGTNIEAALQLAFEKAQEQQTENAQNRIILFTDGAVNLGNADPESLSQIIATIRDSGIAFDAAGISAEGLNDEVLEALTRKGDGRYYLLDSVESADEGFAKQIAGALRPSAKNVKVQVKFNPERVGRYKLLGFEKHRLKKQDFRNDRVDAAELAAAETGVAMYQFEANPEGEGDVGQVSVRFQDLNSGRMIEHCWPIPYQPDAPRCDQASSSLKLATSAAMLATKLKGGSVADTVDLKRLAELMAQLPSDIGNTQRAQQLQAMIQQVRQISGQQ